MHISLMFFDIVTFDTKDKKQEETNHSRFALNIVVYKADDLHNFRNW